MSESYGRLQSVFYSTGSRLNQQYNISQFGTGIRGRGSRGRGRGYGGRGYDCGGGSGRGVQEGRGILGVCGERIYGHNS